MADTKGTLYVLRLGPCGPVKLGFTRRTGEHRRRELQKAHPEELILVAESPAYATDEARLKSHFAPFQMRGEWFRPEAPLLDFVEALTDGVSVAAYLTGFASS